jgi:hypothetical protein
MVFKLVRVVSFFKVSSKLKRGQKTAHEKLSNSHKEQHTGRAEIEVEQYARYFGNRTLTVPQNAPFDVEWTL